MTETHLNPATDAADAADGALFQFLDAEHRQLQRELIDLDRLVNAFAADRLGATGRQRLGKTVAWFNQTARQHHRDEELHVFPALLQSSDPHIVQVTRRLQQDHGWIEQNWLEIEPMLSAVVNNNHWVEPAQLAEATQLFYQLYVDHLVLEESLAYPEARQRIDPAELAASDQAMAERREARATRQASKPAP